MISRANLGYNYVVHWNAICQVSINDLCWLWKPKYMYTKNRCENSYLCSDVLICVYKCFYMIVWLLSLRCELAFIEKTFSKSINAAFSLILKIPAIDKKSSKNFRQSKKFPSIRVGLDRRRWRGWEQRSGVERKGEEERRGEEGRWERGDKEWREKREVKGKGRRRSGVEWMGMDENGEEREGEGGGEGEDGEE